jgi:hypothetical protein
MGAPRRGARMSQAQTFYEAHSFYEGLTWGFIREQIGEGLKERYQVPKELPPKLFWLVKRLDDDRDWLFPSVGWQNDTDLLAGRVQG